MTVALVVGLMLSGYGGNLAGAAAGTTKGAPFQVKTGPIGASTDHGSPVNGGVLRAILDTTDPGGLDPIKNLGSGYVGLNELTAIYDQLIRYDPVTNKYVPQLAKSLTANADHTVYTLKLRPGVKFSDGTPLDSAAVKFGFERFSGPDSAQTYAAILPEIVSMETPDPLTVVMKLNGPDAQFPFMLTLSFGQVPSPTAVQREHEKEFNLHPVGAGPFMVKSYTPGVKLSLVRNPHYWGPAPHLSGIDFTWVNSDRAKVQALQRGDEDLINLTDPIQTQQAIHNGESGFAWLVYADPVVSMNMRKGFLFSDKRLRLAAAYALDPKVVNTRVFHGLAIGSKALFPTGLLSSGAPPFPTDLAKARALVKEVKASTGWNGSFTLLSSSEPSAYNEALNVQAMLNNVGFHVVVSTPPDWVDHVYIKFDDTAAVTSLGLVETDPFAFLVQDAGGAYSPAGFKDPRVDAALRELRAATTEQGIRAATKKLQKLWYDILPEVWLGSLVQTTFWSSKVHGLVPSASSVVLFDKAWLSR